MRPRLYSPRSLAAWREQASADARASRARRVAELERSARRTLTLAAVLAVVALVLASLVLSGVMS